MDILALGLKHLLETDHQYISLIFYNSNKTKHMPEGDWATTGVKPETLELPIKKNAQVKLPTRRMRPADRLKHPAFVSSPSRARNRTLRPRSGFLER